MHSRSLVLVSVALLAAPAMTAEVQHLAKGSVVPPEVFVNDQQGGQARLRALLEAQHGGEVRINYTFADVDAALGRLLADAAPGAP